jgi:hypothetical protein
MKTKKNEKKNDFKKKGEIVFLGKNDYRQKLKTELCRWFQQGKACPKGVDCDFAHGIGEL